MTPISAISPTASSKYDPAGTSGNLSEPRKPALIVIDVIPSTRPAVSDARIRVSLEGEHMMGGRKVIGENLQFSGINFQTIINFQGSNIESLDNWIIEN